MGGGNQVGKIDIENIVSDAKTNGSILSSAFVFVLEEVACSCGKHIVVPVFGSGRELELLQFLLESAGGVIEGLNGTLQQVF